MRAPRVLLLATLVACAAIARAEPKKSAACETAASCGAGLSCVAVAEGKRCVRTCDVARPSSCPADHRCVKDGPSNVCRPISDIDL